MEVEVKLSLPGAEAHSSVLAHLRRSHKLLRVVQQEDFFFDGATKELSEKDVILRLRFFGDSEKCILTLKGKAVIEGGVSRAYEEEEEMSAHLGRQCVVHPDSIASLESALARKARADYGCQGFVGLGGWTNTRTVFQWESDHLLEVDETRFAFGTAYEIECETAQPEVVRSKLESLLSSNSIPYAYSTHSKFHKFCEKNLFPES
mmetsp:Transcript_45580/g.85106  ORF Transcript_45580/g.85106 Transcript_45580/m.85106 type:complete len:205 (+) Transcript_45580:307-921(+)